ncbi:TRAP transporter large permease [Arenibaculum pallidiluteum]|uniref:TRAP transporter large permease n=1 Tax=Arenibaculum pallidiluteum TaxID=2812559 RepID=UPI001A96BFBC|nr:TRAP transporter large permease [Arenibaculum pallidiluteum]
MLTTALITLLALLALSIPVAASMGVLGLVLGKLYSPMPLERAIGEIAWSTSTDTLMVAVPLFVLLGEILLRSGMASRMYGAMSQWLSWLPGGLMHSNIGACALFAATSGSSVATAATVGTVALPEVPRYRYSERIFLGTLAAGGTLGILIPPSINMIIYGVLTDTSVPQLYLAGIIPGLLLAALFMVTVVIACMIVPRWGGLKVPSSWQDRFGSLGHLLPPLGIFLIVVGSIYAGFATPTEAAALGVIAALALAAASRSLSWPMMRECFEGTMRTTAMIMLIIIAAYFLNLILSAIGLASQVSTVVADLGLSPVETIVAIVVFYVILGCFMETLSMMIATVPIVTPIVVAQGYDPVWFGIMLMLLLETALVTPPIGLNLFVVQSIRTRPGPLNDVIVGTVPFVLTMFVMIALLIAFPDLAMWLPKAMG